MVALEGNEHHFLLVCFPAQSHVYPAVRLAGRLTALGVRVTFSTAIYAHRRMFPEGEKSTFPLQDPNDPLFFYHPYSDGFDDTPPAILAIPPQEYMDRVHQVGSETLRAIITSSAKHQPFTCLINTLLLPWTILLARDLALPFATFWIQPASLFLVYHHYFHNHRAAIDNVRQKLSAASSIHEVENPADDTVKDGQYCSVAVDLPGLPRLDARDMPSFLMGTRPMGNGALRGLDRDSCKPDSDNSITDGWTSVFLMEIANSQKIFDEMVVASETKPKVLVNTFDVLEHDALAVLGKTMDFLPIGMVVPPVSTDKKTTAASAASSFIKHDKTEYMEWLDRWPASSVVYISFGSYSVLGKAQVDEFVKALEAINRPFLWVVRNDCPNKPNDHEAFGEKGKIVAWCDQVEVLRHSSVGCFVSHCGWNSTAEAIAAGVPMVAMPVWTDQPMNARLIEAVWKNGVRVSVPTDEVVRAEELERCVEVVMGDGDEGARIRRKAAELGEMARMAVSKGGSSDRNLRAFVEGLA